MSTSTERKNIGNHNIVVFISTNIAQSTLSMYHMVSSNTASDFRIVKRDASDTRFHFRGLFQWLAHTL